MPMVSETAVERARRLNIAVGCVLHIQLHVQCEAFKMFERTVRVHREQMDVFIYVYEQ